VIRSGSNRFGQSVELTELQAANAILGGCPLVDDETFLPIGFAREDVERYASSGSHGRAPAEFIVKKRAALLAAHALRERWSGARHWRLKSRRRNNRWPLYQLLEFSGSTSSRR